MVGVPWSFHKQAVQLIFTCLKSFKNFIGETFSLLVQVRTLKKLILCEVTLRDTFMIKTTQLHVPLVLMRVS